MGLLATWFISSIIAYGVHDTFLSNTTASGTTEMTWSENLERIGFDLRSSTVPYPLRHSPRTFVSFFDQPNPYGFVRDYYFLYCQQSLMGWFGLLGWAAVLYLMFRLFLRGEVRLTVFWISMIILTTILGIVVVGTFDDFGVAHACLLPLMLAGVTLLAAGFGMLRPWVRMTLAVTMIADILLGIILHVRMEMLLIKQIVVRQSDVIPISPALLNVQGVANSVLRFAQGFVYLGDHLVPFSRLNLAIVIAAYAGVVYLIARAAVPPLQADSRKRPFQAILVSLYLLGAMICISDRLAGFEPPPIEQAIPITANSDPKVIEAYFAKLDEQIKANPESAEGYYQRALAFYYLDRFPLAWDQDFNALLLDPFHDRAHYLMALFRIAYKWATPEKPDAMGFVYNREITDNARNYLSYGVELFHRGFQHKAVEVLADAVRRFPDDPGTHDMYARALVIGKTGRGAEAVTEAETALRLAPDTPDYVEVVRNVLSAQGYDAATIEKRIAEIIAEAKKPKP
jgi:tetratricopeptide (TPR) repeat protein